MMMTLKEKFEGWWLSPSDKSTELELLELEKIADDFAIGFTIWKDDNFLMYRDKTYYVKTSSQYFDITKYTGKEKSTKYYTTKELLEMYKQEQEL